MNIKLKHFILLFLILSVLVGFGYCLYTVFSKKEGFVSSKDTFSSLANDDIKPNTTFSMNDMINKASGTTPYEEDPVYETVRNPQKHGGDSNNYFTSFPYGKTLDKSVNITKDYQMLENHPDPGQVTLRQNVNVKHLRIENNSDKPVDVAITTFQYADEDTYPKPLFRIEPKAVKDLGVNPPGGPTQFIWLFDIDSGNLVNDVHAIHNQVNQVVLNEGENHWWIMDLSQPGYSTQK
jgi:hypothetical protein